MARRDIKPEDLTLFQLVSDPQASPDGRRILFAKSQVSDKNKVVANLFTVNVAEGDVKQLTQGEGGAGHGRWSPDGGKVAFISGREKPSAQIYLIPTDGGEASKLTSFPEGSVGGFKWSPDGAHIVAAFRETAGDRTTKAQKEREEKGLSTPPWVIDTTWYREDGDGYFGGQRYKLYHVDVETGKHKLLYDEAAMGDYGFDWLPDSSGLIVSHSAEKDPLLTTPNDQLYHVPLKGKAKMLKGLSEGSKGMPAVSPDGKSVAYVGDHDKSDPWGVRNDKVYISPVDGGEQRCLTDKDDYDVAALTLSDTSAAGSPILEWSTDGKSLFVAVATKGEVQLGVVDVKKGGLGLITEGTHILGVGNTSKDGKVRAMTHADFTSLIEVAVLVGGKTKILTSFNKDYLDKVKVAPTEEVWVDSTDGTKVQTWVVKPADFNPKKTYPCVIEVHGGPHGQYGVGFFHEFQVLAAQGYVVVFSNPRGSKGYGEKFCAAIRGNWGSKDWDDVKAVTEWAQHQTYVKAGQIGVMGGSYGGYMTNWAVSHSDVYKAAITDRCVFNWLSAGGNSDYPLNRDGYFGGKAWGSHKDIKILWDQSPISHFDNVKTPMLIIHSEGDLRCNVEQAEQVFYVLKCKGIETRFVRYPQSTSHGLSRNGPPDLRVHRLNQIVEWWKRFF